MFKKGDIIITKQVLPNSIIRKQEYLNVIGVIDFQREGCRDQWAILEYDIEKEKPIPDKYIAGVYWYNDEIELYAMSPRDKIKHELLKVI